MVKAYFGNPGEDMAEAFHRMLESDTGKKIFTVRILEDFGNPEQGIDMLIVFEDKSVIRGNVSFPRENFGGLMCGLKFKGNLI